MKRKITLYFLFSTLLILVSVQTIIQSQIVDNGKFVKNERTSLRQIEQQKKKLAPDFQKRNTYSCYYNDRSFTIKALNPTYHWLPDNLLVDSAETIEMLNVKKDTGYGMMATWVDVSSDSKNIFCRTYVTSWGGASQVTDDEDDVWDPVIAANNQADKIYVFWCESGETFGSQIFLRRRVTGTWTSEIQLTDTTTKPSNLDAAADKRDWVYLVWQEEDNNLSAIFYKELSGTWKDMVKLSFPMFSAYEAKIDVSTNDNKVHLIYVRNNTDTCQLVYRIGTDGSWTDPFVLYESNSKLHKTAISSDAEGNLLFGWVEGEGNNAKMMTREYRSGYGEVQQIFSIPEPGTTSVDISRTGRAFVICQQIQSNLKVINSHRLYADWSSPEVLVNNSVNPSNAAVVSNFFEDIWLYWVDYSKGQIWYRIGEVDSDGDGLGDIDETHVYSTNPYDEDTDDDNLLDGEEVHIYGSDPKNIDTDTDEMPDGYEVFYGLDPTDNTDASEDLDNDGLNNYMEWYLGFIPNDPDTDDDGLLDGDEHYLYPTYPNDPDCDNDGLLDGEEILTYGTNPLDSDSDNDQMPDGWEALYGLNPLDPTDDEGDLDGDGLDNYREWFYGANPTINDSDGDGLEDGEEYWVYATHPAIADYDGDGLTDYEEVIIHDTNPNSPDTDHDQMDDGYEIAFGLDPRDPLDAFADNDGDGLSNFEEFSLGIYPNCTDSDSDGLDDGAEVYQYFTNPANNDTDGDICFDGWEVSYMFDPNNNTDGSLDFEPDELLNFEEFLYGCNPRIADTDNDTLTDGVEVHTFGTNPTLRDSDLDDLDDNEELTANTDPLNKDTDGDLMPDGFEVHNGLNPLNATDSEEDLDNDGLTNLEEYQSATLPFNFDTDNDTLSDGEEVKIFGTTPTVRDTDGDSMDDGFEVRFGLNPLQKDENGDLDGDGLNNLLEYQIGTYPNATDTDEDGMDDEFEYIYELNPLNPSDAETDLDGDGLTNLMEFLNNGNPNLKDSDEDGLEDNEELLHSTLLDNPDSDGDGMYDGFEVEYGLNPLNSSDAEGDLDDDGLDNFDEFFLHCDPSNPDTDNDGLLDGEEVHIIGTNPVNADTDGDGFSDGEEIRKGTNPLDSRDNPKARAKQILIIVGVVSTIIVILGIMGFYSFRQRQIRIKLEREVEEARLSRLATIHLEELANSERIRLIVDELFYKLRPKKYFKKSSLVKISDSPEELEKKQEEEIPLRSPSTEELILEEEKEPLAIQNGEIVPVALHEKSGEEEEREQKEAFDKKGRRTEEATRRFWNIGEEEFIAIPGETERYIETSFKAEEEVTEIGEAIPSETKFEQEAKPMLKEKKKKKKKTKKKEKRRKEGGSK